jgi:tRNA/tmRNA/rRNA uracil-C5-methylase (TrmA/RlmC/RlmD family)
MNFNDLIKKQFDLQAQNFSDWPVTRNEGYMKSYCEFCHVETTDTLLDVACGSGEFTLYCAKQIK